MRVSFASRARRIPVDCCVLLPLGKVRLCIIAVECESAGVEVCRCMFFRSLLPRGSEVVGLRFAPDPVPGGCARGCGVRSSVGRARDRVRFSPLSRPRCQCSRLKLPYSVLRIPVPCAQRSLRSFNSSSRGFCSFIRVSTDESCDRRRVQSSHAELG